MPGVDCRLFRRSGHQVKKRDIKDLQKVVGQLVKCDAFTEQSNREYKKFSNIPPSLLDTFDLQSMFKWLNEHKKSIFLQKTAR